MAFYKTVSFSRLQSQKIFYAGSVARCVFRDHPKHFNPGFEHRLCFLFVFLVEESSVLVVHEIFCLVRKGVPVVFSEL